MTKTERPLVYANSKQIEFIAAKAQNKDIVGGRGSGKTGLIGFNNYEKMGNMPGAKSGLAALTFAQLLNNSLPSMEQIWKNLNLKEHLSSSDPGHYVIGRRPPSNWKKCLNSPRKFDNVISFFNGYTIDLISLDRKDTVRGKSLDALDIDEKGWVKEDDYNNILFPLTRANRYARFAKHHLHHSRCGYSSMPWLAKQHWILKAEEMALKNPEKYFYLESTAEDNIHVLGQDYLKDAEERLPHIVYMVEYMNQRPKKVSNAFYPAFNDEIHCDYKTYDYDQNEAGLWLTKDSDVKRDKPLELSFDFNAAFTSAIVCQDHGKEFRVNDELFIEEAEVNMIADIVNLFLDRYSDHPTKEVFIHGDRSGNSRLVGDNATFYEQIMNRLEAAGWTCYLMVYGLDGALKKRYFLISDIMSEKKPHMPRLRINQNKCKYLPISLQLAGMEGDFKKNKTGERPGNDQKKATHLSDCLDNILWRKYNNYLEQEVEHWEAGVA